MSEVVLFIGLLLGNLTVTSYRSIPSQTDSSPFHTATGERVCKDGVAVSQDLLKSGIVKYGDWLWIEGIGFKRVNDTMNSRHNLHLDVWVNSWKEENAFHKKFKGGKVRVWRIERNIFNNTIK